jgi:hypothetical protein
MIITDRHIDYRNTYAWVMDKAQQLPKPVPYHHPSGAVIWVNLGPDVAKAIRTR